MSDNFSGVGFRRLNKSLDNCCSGSRESAAFIVVTVSMERVYAIEIPHAGVGVVFHGIHAVELHKQRYRFTGYIPSADPYVDAFGEHGFIKYSTEQGAGFGKIWRWIVIRPHIGSDKNHFVAVLLLECFGFTGKNGVDTADFVANFPADLEEQVYFQATIIHYIRFTI